MNPGLPPEEIRRLNFEFRDEASSFYYGPDGEPIGFGDWTDLFERRVDDMSPESWWRKETVIEEDLRVSTVWIGIDHRFGTQGPPLVWETMVFGAPEELQWRYATRAEAFDDHERIVRELRAGLEPA